MINRMHKARYDSRLRRSVETRLTPAPLPIANASLVYSGDPRSGVWCTVYSVKRAARDEMNPES